MEDEHQSYPVDSKDAAIEAIIVLVEVLVKQWPEIDAKIPLDNQRGMFFEMGITLAKYFPEYAMGLSTLLRQYKPIKQADVELFQKWMEMFPLELINERMEN